MRALVFALAFLLSTPAWCAPICVTRAGDTVHCEAKGAMPVGWRSLDAGPSSASPPNLFLVLGLVGVIGGLFALIALMPEFDGGWDEQEGGDEAG